MDNQEAGGKQGPKVFPFPCLQTSSILAEAPLHRPFPKAAEQGTAWGGGARKRAYLLEEPLIARGPGGLFIPLLCV